MQTDEVVDTTQPTDKWEFNEDVTRAFDNMLRRSIPAYDEMRRTTKALVDHYTSMKINTTIVDLGCSRGEAIADYAWRNGDSTAFVIGLEISKPMVEAARKRFAESVNVQILEHDLRNRLPNETKNASVMLSVLTLQFTPIEYRQRIVQDVYDQLRPGGVFLLVEKVLGSNALLDAAFVDVYYTHKREQGYTEDSIQRKRMSLEGVLVPVTAQWNVDLLHGAGFKSIDCYWRWCNFAAWVAIK